MTNAKIDAEVTTTSTEWGVRIEGERESETQIFTNEWSARDNAESDKAWCSTVPRIIETRTVTRGQWSDATVTTRDWRNS